LSILAILTYFHFFDSTPKTAMANREISILIAAGLVGATLIYVGRKKDPVTQGHTIDPVILQQQAVIDQVKGPQSYAIPTTPHCELYNSVLSNTANGGWIPSSHDQASCCLAAKANPTLARWVGSPCTITSTVGSTTQTTSLAATMPALDQIQCGPYATKIYTGVMGPYPTGVDGSPCYCWRNMGNNTWAKQATMTATDCLNQMCSMNLNGSQVYRWGTH
jgi:hypothetical protein